MRIKRLRIAGFKSFVDPLDLPIAVGLTGVVGPNGCGKSNLLEALRWTMGETSAKSLRGAGMDDVIFAGTATRPPRDFAEVSLLTESAGEEHEVVRRIERGAGSAYRIDGQDVRARDVQLLFADAATGAHSPAMVGQGRIGAVIAARPAERRAMLEEAAGIAGLHVRRRDAENRLRAAETNLERLDAVIADQSARVGQLRRQARAAERYRDLSERIRLAEARLIFARWREAATAADAAKAEADGMAAKVAAATGSATAASDAQGRAVVRLVEARAAAQGARERAGEAGHLLATLRRDLTDAVREERDHAAAVRRLADERGRETALARDAAQAIERLAADKVDLDAALADAIRAGPAHDAALAEAERATADAEVALAQGQARAATEVADARVAAAALAQARTRRERVARDEAQLAVLTADLGAPGPLGDARDAAAARQAAATATVTSAKRDRLGAEAREGEALAARDTAEAARAAARAELATIDAGIAALTKATARATTGGARDRLLDHLSARPGFERALAAALDDDLDTAFAAWAGAGPQPGDPPPPAGTEPIANGVTAPAALARRLAQVFVAARDEDQPLAVGQRLVTHGGSVRRWDGYRAQGGGAAAAALLERLNRLAVLTGASPAARGAVAAATALHADTEAAIVVARRVATEARTAVAQAESDARDAARDEDRAVAALERLTQASADLAARRARVAADRDEAVADLTGAQAAQAALPDGRDTADAASRLSAAAEAARATVARARAARLVLDADAGRSRERLAGIAAEARSWRARAGEATGRVAAADRQERELAAAAEVLTGRPEALRERIAAAEADHGRLSHEADAALAAERDADRAAQAADAALRSATADLSSLREARAAALARFEAQEMRRVELGRVAGERFASPAVLLPERQGFVTVDVRLPAEESAALDRLTLDRERLGPVNLVAEQELAALETSGATSAADRAELGEAIARLRGSIGALNREGRQRLLAAFEAVDGHFRRLFATLFEGGGAHLQLIDSDDPLEAGLEILAQPPGKRLQSLTLLSGGEQALTAVALIFALFLTNPAPICVLDEVDAPLDDANIDRFCGLLDRMAADTDTRYLVVTHNAVTMSRMQRLFGVTMIEPGVSRLVSVDLGGAERLLATA